MGQSLPHSFFEDLKVGRLKWLTERVNRDPTLCLELRGNSINIYYRGGNLLEVKQKTSSTETSYSPKFDKKYLRYGNDVDIPEDVTDVPKWDHTIPLLKDAMDRWFGENQWLEREFQQLTVRENNRVRGLAKSTDYFILDIECNRDGSRFDMLAVRWLSETSARRKADGLRLALIEMKYADAAHRGKKNKSDGDADGAAGLVAHFKDIRKLITDKKKLQALKGDMVEVFRQKWELGLIDCVHPVKSFDDDSADILFLIANHDPAKTALREELVRMRDSLPEGISQERIRFLRSSFFGYGLYDANTVGLSDMIDDLERLESVSK
jgi:hypothetical protein